MIPLDDNITVVEAGVEVDSIQILGVFVPRGASEVELLRCARC